MQDVPALDPVFHQIVRTRLGGLLNVGACSFTDLKNRLGVTDGNLDAHLRKLSAAGYLHSRMVLKDRPQTIYSFSPSGKRAFAAYIVGLRAIIEAATKRHAKPRWSPAGRSGKVRRWNKLTAQQGTTRLPRGD